MKIGHFSNEYAYERNIINKVSEADYELLNVHDDLVGYFMRVLLWLCNKLEVNESISGKIRTRVLAQIRSVKKYDVELIHSFNAIIRTGIPYVITFETGLPRCSELLRFHHEVKQVEFNRSVKKYITQLDGVNCKRLIAMSMCAKKICEAELLESGLPEDMIQRITEKITVLHPPQRQLVTEQDIRNRYNDRDEKLRFIFIGRDFFRKGGKEIINGLKKYANQCELIIISTLNFGDYASHATKEEKKDVEQYISNQSWIKWIKQCDNQRVLELCKTAHVGLLPTFADTYGYSVLEMQACGVPVITTNVRALPEINSNDCGWVAMLSVNQYGEALYSNLESRNQMKHKLSEELERIFNDIFLNPDSLQGKAIASLDRIKRHHSPEKYGEELKKIYIDAI